MNIHIYIRFEISLRQYNNNFQIAFKFNHGSFVSLVLMKHWSILHNVYIYKYFYDKKELFKIVIIMISLEE